VTDSPSETIVGVVSYQAGNIRSIVNAIEHLGATALPVSSSADLERATHLLLPGVGAFGYCADRLRASGLQPSLERWLLQEQRPMLGICVGMQLLADWSEELGHQQGLGWGGGSVRRLRPESVTTRVPHVGWNTVHFEEDYGEFKCGDSVDFYFDHSYAYQDPNPAHRLASCTHGQTFCAAIRRGPLVAAQFHPEKSQTAGMRFLRSFLMQGMQSLGR
jgi:glutamine amidotransferase